MKINVFRKIIFQYLTFVSKYKIQKNKAFFDTKFIIYLTFVKIDKSLTAMKLYLKSIILLTILLVFFTSCEKPAGEGGYATVKGTVLVRDYNSTFTILRGEYPALEENVYIIYGDEYGYSDRTRTDYQGRFSFNYLRPGNYEVYVFSKDSTLTSIAPKIAVNYKFTINKGDKEVVIPQMIIFD